MLERTCSLTWIAIACTVVAFAGGPTDKPAKVGEPIKLTGYFTDEWCGKANANPQGAECARMCAKKGSPMLIYADGKMYKVRAKDKPRAVEYVGVEVTVQGTLLEDGSLKIASVSKTKR